MNPADKQSNQGAEGQKVRRRRLSALALADIARTLKPGKGRGRPTDASWKHQAKVPMSLATKQQLEQLAREVGVGYTQLAARLVEGALASKRVVEANREIARANEMQRWPTKVPATPSYYTKLMAYVYYDPSEANLKRALEGLDKGDWLALFKDSAPETAAFGAIREIAPQGRQSAAKFIDYVLSLLSPPIRAAAEQARKESKKGMETPGVEQGLLLESVRISKEALDSVAKANALLVRWGRMAAPSLKIESGRFSHRVVAELLSQNNDPPELGEGVGSMFARKALSEAKGMEEFEKGWWDIGAVEGIIREPKHLCFLLNALRGYVRTTALHDWLRTPADQLKLDHYIPKSLHDSSRKLAELMPRMGVPWLYFGYSQFHEDRLFSSFASLVFDRLAEGDAGLNPHVLDYTLKSHQRRPLEADFRLMNESAFTESTFTCGQRPIFRHNGYKVFVRTDYLRSLANSATGEPVPQPVIAAAERLLRGGKVDEGVSRDLAARCWMACSAGLPWISGTEFNKIVPAVAGKASSEFGHIAEPSASDIGDPSIGFDDLFEAFIMGRRNVFVGGSLHDRLIEGWLLDFHPPLFKQLLEPADFAKLGVDLNTFNRVVVGRELQKRLGYEALKTFINLLDAFLIDVGTALTQVAADTLNPANREAAEIARFLSAQLALLPPDPHCVQQWRWSFISRLSDFNPLVRSDMTCPPHTGSVKSPITESYVNLDKSNESL